MRLTINKKYNFTTVQTTTKLYFTVSPICFRLFVSNKYYFNQKNKQKTNTNISGRQLGEYLSDMDLCIMNILSR